MKKILPILGIAGFSIFLSGCSIGNQTVEEACSKWEENVAAAAIDKKDGKYNGKYLKYLKITSKGISNPEVKEQLQSLVNIQNEYERAKSEAPGAFSITRDIKPYEIEAKSERKTVFRKLEELCLTSTE